MLQNSDLSRTDVQDYWCKYGDNINITLLHYYINYTQELVTAVESVKIFNFQHVF